LSLVVECFILIELVVHGGIVHFLVVHGGKRLLPLTFNLTIQHDTHPIEDIVYTTYPELQTKYIDAKYLEERVILAPTNDVV
jgi:hypothetical protein